MRALVTGGGGFLGGAIIRMLRARGDEVVSFSRGAYPALEQLGVRCKAGDLADLAAVRNAVEGCDLVFHVAAKAGVWGPARDYYETNVVGTKNVLQACRELGVSRIVYTSSPSVVFHGRDMEGVDESVPYPKRFHASYPRTKAQAEKAVLAANSPTLATVALRPHLIWGPGDNHLIPRLIARAKAGKLRRVGSRPNRVDCIYVDNAAEAHLLAADRLTVGSALAGKAYFLSQGDPRPLWDLVNGILGAFDLPPVQKTISPRMAYAVGWLLETTYGLFRVRSEPRMTRFLAMELSTAHWFNISAARRDLGYEPRVSIEQGLQNLRQSLAR